jgi:hypothetical protein
MSHRLVGIRQNPLSVIVFGILAFGIIFMAAEQVFRYGKYGDLQYWARNLEKGDDVQTAMLDHLAERAHGLVRDKECQGPFIKSVLTIVLNDLDRHSPNGDYEAWSRAIRQNDEFLQHALSCLPTNGNFWVRFAMVRQAINEQPSEVARLVTLSQLYSPAEEDAIVARYNLYNRLTDASLQVSAAPLVDDLKILCSPTGERLRTRLAASRIKLQQAIARLAPGCPAIGVSRDRQNPVRMQRLF